MRTRDLQVSKATKKVYRAARRPRRPKIMQVPAVDATASRQTKRPVVVPYTTAPIKWSAARVAGRAYGRILEGLSPKPEPDERKKTTSHRPKKVAKYKRDPKGNWWMERFADVVERRKIVSMPAYRSRVLRRTSQANAKPEAPVTVGAV